MRHRLGTLSCLVMTVAVVGLMVPAATAGQATGAWTLPRTPDGHPDLQGVWANNNVTPLERPEAWAGKDTLTVEELAALQVAAANAVGDGDALFGDQLVLAAIEGIEATSYDPTTGNYNQFWIADRDFTNRTSLVIDPPDGRVPPLTAEATAKQEAQRLARDGIDRHSPTPGGWVEDLGSGMFAVRCILGFNSGPPMSPAGYNQNVQIAQTEDHVLLLNEMVHSSRVIPLDGRTRLPERVRQWMGDSRGHWAGDTLVVETTNFLRETSFRAGVTTPDLRLIERFTRVSDGTLMYEVTVEDPSAWDRPWTYRLPMVKSEFPLFEYACHEGNYGLYNILAGAREQEAAAAK